MRALVVAFDGVLADTLPLRAHALADACAAEFNPRSVEQALTLLPGRTLLEASLALFPDHAASDPTLPELVALRAQRAYRHLVQHGVSLRADVITRLREASSLGTRVIVRADSERRDVEPLLAMVGLDHAINVLRCSDDAPRGPGASLVRSWQAIGDRLHGMQISMTARTTIETNLETLAVARPFVSSGTVY